MSITNAARYFKMPYWRFEAASIFNWSSIFHGLGWTNVKDKDSRMKCFCPETIGQSFLFCHCSCHLYKSLIFFSLQFLLLWAVACCQLLSNVFILVELFKIFWFFSPSVSLQSSNSLDTIATLFFNKSFESLAYHKTFWFLLQKNTPTSPWLIINNN